MGGLRDRSPRAGTGPSLRKCPVRAGSEVARGELSDTSSGLEAVVLAADNTMRGRERELMAPKGRYVRRTAPTPPPEVPEPAVLRWRQSKCNTLDPLQITRAGYPANPEPRVVIFVGLVPVQGPVYRYKEADCVQFELQGCFCICGLLFEPPRPLGLLLSLAQQERR
uniref:Uncharacterized protein n=1 Tax=Ananas comosus var. bracteatus TaxID=296719 RepID=A0A6V7Q2F1_ANACO|nr:unnamed protein product [Ananas comosus var. bracteatus]